MNWFRDTSEDRKTLRDMLDDVRWYRMFGVRVSENGSDVTDNIVSDQLRRARQLWRVIAATERNG